MSSDRWTALLADLTTRVEALPPKGVVLLTGPEEPAAADAPRRGLFRRRPAPPAPPYVQFLEVRGDLCAECVGPGYRDIPPDVQQQLLGLGWMSPDDWENRSDNYQKWFRPDRAAEAAELGTASLRLLGADPETLEIRAWAD